MHSQVIRKASSSLESSSQSRSTEIFSGVVVALASIPSSIAFANIAGVNPLVGIWSSVILGLISTGVGGAPGLIAGAAGVVAVPLAPLIANHGVAFMGPTVFLAAAAQLIFGVLKLGRLVDLVDDNIMSGFLNGLGLLLIKSQLAIFSGLSGQPLAAASAVAAGTAAITTFLPRVTTAIPSALAGVAAATAATTLLAVFAPAFAASCSVGTLADTAGAATFAGGVSVLPSLRPLVSLMPPPEVSWAAAIRICGPAAMSVAAISILETLLAGKVAEAEGGRDGNGDRLLVGLSLGNFASACFGGFGGCGLIPQTVLNRSAGGRGALSSASYALTMALSVICLARIIGAIPLASLAGVMLTVAASTVQVAWTRCAFSDVWSGGAGAKAKLLILLTTSTICFKVDMAAGITTGVVLSALAKSARGG